jgi:hypothetical protein
MQVNKVASTTPAIRHPNARPIDPPLLKPPFPAVELKVVAVLDIVEFGAVALFDDTWLAEMTA